MTPSMQHHDDAPAPHVEEVSDGVFAYIQLDGSWGLNNTGFIVGRDAVVAIDCCFTERRTRWLLDTIRRYAGTKPVRALINTHHHGDHTHGNYLFLPDATIIGHALCRETMLGEGLAAMRFFPDVEWGQIEVAPPSVTFDDRLDLWIDDLKLELIYAGPAHTTNDIVVWIPQRKVLFAGDIIFNGGTPFVLAGSIEGSLEALARVQALSAESIVPGHGAVCAPDVIADVDAYLRLVQAAAREGHAANAEPLEVARELDLGPFTQWLDPERLAANVHRAYSELRGEALGTPLGPQAVRDMIAYNGGEPPRCLA